MSSVLKYMANTSAVNKFEKWALKETPVKKGSKQMTTNYSKLQTVYPIGLMLYTEATQIGFISQSKDMPKKRRVPLIIDIIANGVIGLSIAFLTKKPINKLIDKSVKRANVLYANSEHKESLINGMKTAIPFLTTILTFKYVASVLATPAADKVNKFLIKKGWVDYSKEDNKTK